jgi:mono/diheme cytochrome c family protein
MRKILMGIVLTLAVTGAQASDVERGRAIAEEWCSICHAQTAAESGPDMELSFEELVARPLNDAARLRALMDEDHFPMTTYRLFSFEKDDVVAYLIDLREQ